MAILTEIQEQEVAAAYDVFLSFRGIDTRLTFIDHLYQALINENVRTFLDEEDVEIGEELKPELERAIKSSRASIIVLSKNYASSAWCLDELVMILEQQRNSNHIVLPIFYHVEPTHVRKQENSFGEALTLHTRRVDAEENHEKKSQRFRKLELWTKALAEVADLKGKDANGRRETVFIEEIVKEINRKLDLHLQSNKPDLIGMDSSILTITSWLKEKSSNKRNAAVDGVYSGGILTIWGMAGIGKTSLAEYIFKSNYNEFERSSFLYGIERKCAEQCSALFDLQKQLLRDVLKKSSIELRDTKMGTSMLETALSQKQTLVVLDGIDSFEQVDVLLGTTCLHPGSKIMITTKDRSLTKKCALFHTTFPPKHTEHELYGLSDKESLRLLCRHAFGGDVPKEGYEQEATRLAKYCGGHPLALKLLGSSRMNESVITWNDICENLKTEECYPGVHKSLRISFDTLPTENTKELFKHIACFFVGCERYVVETILKECGIHTSHGIPKLIDRCLLTIGSYNKLEMHQLVQEMGRELVRQESPRKPWKRSRLWDHEECLNLLQEDKGTSSIQGLFLDMNMLDQEALRESRLRTDVLCKMDRLHLLQLNHVKLEGSYKNFPKGLKNLCMHGFQLKYIPFDLPMDTLVALDMSYSDLEQLWEKPKVIGSLKFLNFSYSNLVRVGGFCGLPSLERLILTGCEHLIEVCETVGECVKLANLDVSYCKKLKQIPSSINKLKNLEILRMEGCVGVTEVVLRSPNSFFLFLPASLVELSLADNSLSNESFPTDFSGMPKLNYLCLDDNPIHSIPDCVGSLSNLQRLSVDRCSMLKSIVCPTSTIISLHAKDCVSLKKIIFHPEMTRPPFIFYEGASSLNEIDCIIKFQDLATVGTEILCALGWKSLQTVQDQKVKIQVFPNYNYVMELPIQMCYEFGIFSTYFVGKEVPNWLANKSNGSSILFTMPSSPVTKFIQGLNICFVHTSSSTEFPSLLWIKVRNITKNHTWIYWRPTSVYSKVENDLVWLTHWTFGNNELEDGDEVLVSIIESEESGGLIVKQCGVSPVYTDRDTEVDPLVFYKLWKHRIGGDLSGFQLTSGDYFLAHPRLVTLWYNSKYGEQLLRGLEGITACQNFIGCNAHFKDPYESVV